MLTYKMGSRKLHYDMATERIAMKDGAISTLQFELNTIQNVGYVLIPILSLGIGTKGRGHNN